MDQPRRVASVGCGTIGYSFALKFAMAGNTVMAYNRTEQSGAEARRRMEQSLAFLVENGVVAREAAPEITGRVTFTCSMEEAVSGAQFIQESLPERYDVKQQALEKIEQHCPEDCLIASSSSGLLISEISKFARHPQRLLGGHPYNPPHLIPLVEVTRGEQTAQAAIEAAVAFYRSVGSEPVVLQKETLGFICNRLQMALYREVCNLVVRGVCTVEDTDRAMLYGPGIRWGVMGPSLLFELGGGAGGVSGMMENLGDSFALWFEDMAEWKRYPPEWPAIVQAGVDEELRRRSPQEGNTRQSLEAYRDRMLIQLLRLHGKL